MSKTITKKEYENAMARINALIEKGSDKVSKEELEEIRRLALIAQAYEKRTYTIF